MAKDPAFLFYPNDYIGGTMGMTFEEKGAYMELLMLQFNRGHMTKDMIGRTVGQLWVNIKDKFIEDFDGCFYNQRLEDEKNKRKAFSESRRNNRKGVNQYTKSKTKKSGHTTSHMEDVDVNKDLVSNVNNKGVRYFENEQLNDVFTRWLRMLHERKKPMTQSSIEALQMKLSYQTPEKSIAQITQSLEKNWLNLRPLEESEVSKETEEEIDIAIIKAARNVQLNEHDNDATENNRLRGISKE